MIDLFHNSLKATKSPKGNANLSRQYCLVAFFYKNMKGFYIEVTNNLLDKKHRKNMGTAVWEFMWCLDKMTKIENDIGYVYGGAPINLSDIKEDLGIDEKNISKNLQKLENAGYIQKIRTPYGIVIRVAKPKKRFHKKVNSLKERFYDNVESHGKNARSNKTVTIDNNNKDVVPKGTTSPTKKSMEPEYITNIDPETGEEVTQDRFGRPLKKKSNLPKGNKAKEYHAIYFEFIKRCQKEIGITPVIHRGKMLAAISFAMNTGKLTKAQVLDLFDEWFSMPKPDEELLSVSRALSAHNITGYKARNNIT